MQARSIILLALGGVAVLLLVGLAVATRSDGEVEISDSELAAARALHQQRQVRAPSASPSRSDRWRPSRPARREPERGEEPPAEAEEPVLDEALSLEDQMDAANALYDRADYIGARTAALAILQEHPDNVRMLRIAVSVACMMGAPDEAQGYYDRLPDRDQRQMARRCKRYGVEF